MSYHYQEKIAGSVFGFVRAGRGEMSVFVLPLERKDILKYIFSIKNIREQKKNHGQR